VRKELDEALCARYPLIFKDRNADMHTTAMCWGFDCGDGWYNIIDVLCGKLCSEYYAAKSRYEFIKDKVGEKMYGGSGNIITQGEIDLRKQIMEEEASKVPLAVQVKEKFGGLRFYYDGGDAEISGMVRMAESWADHTCEKCGNKGERRSGGWIRTLCDKHEAEYQARKNNV
jgi:hypothetical protein